MTGLRPACGDRDLTDAPPTTELTQLEDLPQNGWWPASSGADEHSGSGPMPEPFRIRLSFGDLHRDRVKAGLSCPLNINRRCRVGDGAELGRGGTAALGACERHNGSRVGRQLPKENLVTDSLFGWKLQPEPGANTGFHS